MESNAPRHLVSILVFGSNNSDGVVYPGCNFSCIKSLNANALDATISVSANQRHHTAMVQIYGANYIKSGSPEPVVRARTSLIGMKRNGGMMKNYAGCKDKDHEISKELNSAGITVNVLPESMRESNGEVKTIIIGSLGPWVFKRFWYYWVASGPGIPLEYAEPLHESYGKDVRVGGHCGCPSPREWYNGFSVGLYHVDTQDGLNALAKTIKKVMDNQ